jgi:hypothetical protein
LSQGVRYIVDKINNEKTLPFNLTLGFIVMNACPGARGIDMNLGILRLLKHTECKTKYTSHGRNHTDIIHSLIAIVSHADSAMSRAASTMQTRSRIPVLSMYASSDILSNKMKFPYFNRMVPPSKYDMHGVLSLLEYFKWT